MTQTVTLERLGAPAPHARSPAPMTVFIAHAPADRPAAELLEAALERRGHFVERDDGEVALAPPGWTCLKQLGKGARQPTVRIFRASPASP